jgi:hypothetical protein
MSSRLKSNKKAPNVARERMKADHKMTTAVLKPPLKSFHVLHRFDSPKKN